MPAKRVERHDWSTSLCAIVTMPEEPARVTIDGYRTKLTEERAWLADPHGPTDGVYTRTVCLIGPGREGLVTQRIVYRFSDPQTARMFALRFCY